MVIILVMFPIASFKVRSGADPSTLLHYEGLTEWRKKCPMVTVPCRSACSPAVGKEWMDPYCTWCKCLSENRLGTENLNSENPVYCWTLAHWLERGPFKPCFSPVLLQGVGQSQSKGSVGGWVLKPNININRFPVCMYFILF